jgi:hypothetical protein
MNDTKSFSRVVPPLASLPKCTDCGKRFMPALATIPRCFKCEIAAKRVRK